MRRHAPRTWWLGCVAVAAAVVGLGGAGPVQPEARPAPANTEELLARNLTRLALMDLRAVKSPAPQDYGAAATLLVAAHELTPQDAELIRRAIEASHLAGDQARELELTRALLRLEPEAGDTVAQLRLITASIAQAAQNADDRLRLYENYLSGPHKNAFDESIRSRLALDAALLLRDRGDERGFVEKLKQAITLDRTNKEAAALGATFYALKRPDERAKSLEWLVIVLLADPLDPNVHFSMARELAAAGAYAHARRFHRNAMAITAAAGGQDQDFVVERAILQWYTEGPAATVSAINHELVVRRADADRELRRLRDAKLPTDTAGKPEDIRLSLPISGVVVLAAQASGDEAALKSAIEGVAGTVADALPKLQNAVKQGILDEAEAGRRAGRLLIELNTLRLWAGVQTEEAQRELGNVEKAAGDQAQAAALLGWTRLRQNDAPGAAALFEPWADELPLARLGLGAAREAIGDRSGAIEVYTRLLRDHTLELPGAYSAARLKALGVAPDDSQRSAMEAVADSVPDWVDRMTARPREFLRVDAEVVERNPEAVERMGVRVSVQNLTDTPLAFGSDRTVSSRFLLSPRFEGADLVEGLDRPEVVDIGRRLRLKPRERATVVVWSDPGRSGWLMEAMSHKTFRIRWRIIQGFRLDPVAGFQPGPMCLTSETASIVKRALPESSMSAADLATRFAGEPADTLPRLAMALRSFLLHPTLTPPPPAPAPPRGIPLDPLAPQPNAPRVFPTPEELRPVLDAVVARYPNLTPVQRALLASILPHARLCPEAAAFDQLVRNDHDPLVQLVALSTRVAEPSDEYLARAAQSPDERVRALAEDLGYRLKGSDPVYARLTPADLKAAATAPSPPMPGNAPAGAPGAGAGR